MFSQRAYVNILFPTALADVILTMCNPSTVFSHCANIWSGSFYGSFTVPLSLLFVSGVVLVLNTSMACNLFTHEFFRIIGRTYAIVPQTPYSSLPIVVYGSRAT